MIIIPTTGKPNSTQRVTLDGRTYTLGLRFNEREGFWYLSLSDAQGVLLAPVKVVTSVPLTRLLRGSRRPQGEIFAMDRSNREGNPGLTDLGTRVVLVYVSKDIPQPVTTVTTSLIL